MDRWIKGRTATEIAPEVVKVVSTRRKNSRLVADALPDNRWVLDVAGNLSEAGVLQCVQLWLEISTVNRHVLGDDRFEWLCAAGRKYTAKDTYSRLYEGSIRYSMEKPVWRSYAPLKCKIFAWLALRYRLWTSDRRARHNLQDHTSACFTCLQEEDNTDHVLVQCVYARQAWLGCLRRARLELQEPQVTDTLENWWLAARQRIRRADRRTFDTLTTLTAWMLWKQRNARVFGNTRDQCEPEVLVDRIREEMQLWELAATGGSRIVARE
jgi:hypothetical protein